MKAGPVSVEGTRSGMAPQDDDGTARVRVLISYAHGDPDEDELVRAFWTLLRHEGIDARIDLTASVKRQFWPAWMDEQIRLADHVLVVVSPRYRALAEGRDVPGLGVPWEARQLQEILYARFTEGMRTIMPVVLPRYSRDDIPSWLFPAGGTSYPVPELTSEGIDGLMRMLTGQPLHVDVPLGTVRERPPHPPADLAHEPPGCSLEIRATLTDGVLNSAVHLDGTLLGTREAPLPPDVLAVWRDLPAGADAAEEHLLRVGHALTETIFDADQRRAICARVTRRGPGEWFDVVLSGDGDVLSLPIELLRLATDTDDLGPLGLLAGATTRRCLPGAHDPRRLPGPLKILAAVSAPDETRTGNAPLDVEAEMQAVLDAVGEASRGQVRVLEVASLAEITGALREDDYHVLHLSAHGSSTSIELEDEDGGPVEMRTQALVDALRDSDAHVPLIVLASCSGAGPPMATSLVHAGADRVIAMQAAVTDEYATALVGALYQELATVPGQPVAAALARARRQVEQRPHDEQRRPEFGVATLLSAGPDRGLVDVGAAPVPLRSAPVAPTGTSVRELSLGHLIGRRPQLRETTAVLRRSERAVAEHGAISGVQLIGIGGIGKTAIAGRVLTRLRGDGRMIAVHEGGWNPTALFTAVAEALAGHPELRDAAATLAAAQVEGTAKVTIVGRLLATAPLVLVFDDFEQNLTPGGIAFVDPTLADVLTRWCDAADTGAVLVTSRHPLPDDDRYLVRVPVPPLSPAELRRLLLRLPALRQLPADEQLLLARVIDGHPRLIEYVDALTRGKPARLKEVNARLRRLAADAGVDVRRPRPVDAAIDDALLLGSADILLDELLALLTDHEHAVLTQLSVSRAPMTLDELAFALKPDAPVDATGSLHRETDRLTDLTLLEPGPDVLVHPWTAELLERRAAEDRRAQHERALAVRARRLEQGCADYADLVDLTRHLAALGRHDKISDLAAHAGTLLGTLAASAYLAEARTLVPADSLAWLMVAKQEYEAVRRAGNLGAAANLVSDMRACVERRASDDPDNSSWAGHLSVVLVALGDLHTARGDLAAAEHEYRSALDATEEWSRHRPDDMWWQNRSAVINSRLGNLAIAAGDPTTAATHYRAGFTIRQQLTTTDPTNTGWQRNLSTSHNKLGDLAADAGDPTTAATHYRAALTIRERLVALDPTNTEWQRNLSISHNKLGNLATAGDPTTAATHYRAALTIRERLVALDPTNTEWQRDLSTSQNKLGDLAAAAGDPTTAATHYRAALTIRERLVALDPTNARWRVALKYVRQRLAELSADENGGEL